MFNEENRRPIDIVIRSFSLAEVSLGNRNFFNRIDAETRIKIQVSIYNKLLESTHPYNPKFFTSKPLYPKPKPSPPNS
jgi:hypothetical protein